MSIYHQDTTPNEFVELQKKLLYDGPHEQEIRIIEATHSDLSKL